ncbi:MAG TPA: NAD(P)-dependent oxidoreductase [Chthoniobacteraceae bacterium]|nr:NAD(P)-dependent oxidoreductase [Chthoniobacteraceae bacterium]
MKVLITGSLGYIGTRVIPLINHQFDLLLTDLRAGEIAGKPVVPLDITDYPALLEASKGVDAILHLAIASYRDIVTDAERFGKEEGEEYWRFRELSIETNIRGTHHVLEAARRNGIARVVYGSSLTVLIGRPFYEAVDDDLPPRPSNFYGVTKLWGEQLAEFFSRQYGLRIYCLRFGTPYPQPDQPYFERMLRDPVVWRTFVTYGDLASAMTAALEAEGPLFGAYTVVSATSESIFDLSKGAEINWRPGDFIAQDGAVRSFPG